MHLRNDRRGMTAMIDAMIFIIIMGLVVSAVFAMDDDEDVEPNNASAMCKKLIQTDLRLCDVMDTEDQSGMMMPDLMAACTMSDELSSEYITDVLDSITERPGAYRLTMDYNEKELVLGTGDGTPVSGYTTESPISFGGILTITLELF